MKLENETLSKLLYAISETRRDEIDCECCYEEMDQFAEMLREGKDPAEIMPLVQHHLAICSDCHEEFEALLQALQAE